MRSRAIATLRSIWHIRRKHCRVSSRFLRTVRCVGWTDHAEECIHNGELERHHRPRDPGGQGGVGGRVAKVAATLAVPFTPINPWAGGAFGVAALISTYLDRLECGCGVQDGCEGKWSCCGVSNGVVVELTLQLSVDIKNTTVHEQMTNGTARCDNVKTKRFCTIKTCGKAWDVEEPAAEGCTAFCRGPDQAPPHAMFNPETGEIINPCIDTNKGGRHLGHKLYSAEHPAEEVSLASQLALIQQA